MALAEFGALPLTYRRITTTVVTAARFFAFLGRPGFRQGFWVGDEACCHETAFPRSILFDPVHKTVLASNVPWRTDGHVYRRENDPQMEPSVLRLPSNRWTIERIARLAGREVTQLRANAQNLGEAEVVALCDQVLLLERPRDLAEGAGRRLKTKHPLLVTRRSAFETRGVTLRELSSWGGIRPSDGAVVMSIWKDDIQSEKNGGWRYLLWAPNLKGSRPWSDKPGGRERLEHCRQACERGSAEALLVYGEPLAGHLPEDRAATVSGVDPSVVLHVEVVLREREYWAIWGARKNGVARSL